MRTRWHQTHDRRTGKGGLERDDIGVDVEGAGRVGSDSGGSWLSGRRGGCGMASPRPLGCLAGHPLDPNSRSAVQFPAPPN